MKLKRRAINREVLYENRFQTFMKPPVTNGDLFVRRNQYITGNLNVGKTLTINDDLDVGGDLHVGGDQTIDGKLDVTGDTEVHGNTVCDGDLQVTGDVHVTSDVLIDGSLNVVADITTRDITARDITTRNHYATGNYYLDGYILIPAGSIIQSAAVNTPIGWLDCDGRTVMRTQYPDLFAAIGYSYGPQTNEDIDFYLPDLRGRVAIGVGQGDGLTNRSLTEKSGVETHVLTVEELPPHSHSLTRRSNSDEGTYDTNNLRAFESSAITSDRATLGNFNTYNTGSNQGHNNMQPYIVLRYLIKY